MRRTTPLVGLMSVTCTLWLGGVVVVLVLEHFTAPPPKATGGAVLGGIVGGLLGSTIGGGSGRLAATTTESLVGSIIGSEVGRALDRADRLIAQHTAQSVLENGRNGTTSRWTNPDTGHSGTIAPSRTYQASSGQYCREYQQTVTVAGRTESAFGTACRAPDGTWRSQLGEPALPQTEAPAQLEPQATRNATIPARNPPTRAKIRLPTMRPISRKAAKAVDRLSGSVSGGEAAKQEIKRPPQAALRAPRPGTAEDLVVNVGDRVFFSPGEFRLTNEGRRTLESQAAWLRNFRNTRATVAGHAADMDAVKGEPRETSREFALALGERRAKAMRDHLIALGVEPNRLRTISYGKERPVDPGSNEVARAKNRRAVLSID